MGEKNGPDLDGTEMFDAERRLVAP